MNQSPTATLRVDYPHVANRDEMPMALGRNDWFNTIALCIMPMDHPQLTRKLVRLEPFNSRGNIGRCAIELPLDARVLREIGEKLLELADYAHFQGINAPAPASSGTQASGQQP
jgi:hypothetical protein